jgi:hypothetical protein
VAREFAEHGNRIFLAMGRMVKGIMPRGLSGRIAVHRDAFLATGGYDERFAQWGPDDKDFNCRLRRMGYEYREIPRHFLDCVRHNDRMRFREYREARTACDSQDDDAWGWVRERPDTVVNFGRVGQARVVRNPPPPVDLPPLPTRVWGIGMHKTGTTSLHWALRGLGLDCAHWPSAHWARAVWEEMTRDGRSATLERSYAACDLPLTLLYRELDRGYPGSRFVLTERPEDQWLASVERHWDRAHNEFRAQWDADPFTHRVHRLLYGRKSYHAATMLARYRAHNAAVREYFRDRPDDLLILDEPAWGPLCRFLRLPVPAAPYPNVNRSTDA